MSLSVCGSGGVMITSGVSSRVSSGVGMVAAVLRVRREKAAARNLARCIAC